MTEMTKLLAELQRSECVWSGAVREPELAVGLNDEGGWS